MERSVSKAWLTIAAVVIVGLLAVFPSFAIADDAVSNEGALDSSAEAVSAWEAFPDVAADVEKAGGPEKVWYVSQGWLDYVVSNGLITGYTDSGNFGPNDSITRGQVATILYRAATGDANPDNSLKSTFPDVKSGAYYTAAVEWAYENGVVTGYTSGSKAGKFGPNDKVTREQLATMIARFAETRGEDPYSITPAVYAGVKGWNKVSNYALMPMAWCYYYGVLSGVGGVDLAPQATATRAQMSKMITVVMRGSLTPAIPLEGEWAEDAKGWRYLYPDGTYAKSRWKQIDGSWYCFDSAGYMKTGWYENSDGWYYLKASGELAIDEWVNDRYYFGEDGLWTIVEPVVNAVCLDDVDPSCRLVFFYMENLGGGTIRIHGTDAWLSDDDYEGFDRDLALTDDNGDYLNWIEFPPGSSDVLFFEVIGEPTWFDEGSDITFFFEYDGAMWAGWVSAEHGFNCVFLGEL